MTEGRTSDPSRIVSGYVLCDVVYGLAVLAGWTLVYRWVTA